MLVLVYWLSLPGLAPAMVSALEALDSDHEVQVTFEKGHWEVVLHHDADHHAHSHGKLTKLITGITAHDEDDDHVLHFADSSDAFSISKAVQVLTTAAMLVPWQDTACYVPSHDRETMQHPAARPPPLASMGMLCLRTTVLLV